MKRKRLGFVLLFVVGLSILLYPTISNKWNVYRASRLITDYGQSVELSKSDLSEMLKAAQDYNETLKGSAVPDAFSIRDGVEDPEYEALLNVSGNGMMGVVEIPQINVNIPIYHYTTDEVLEKGAGHLLGSSLPVGGEGTHAVISAHRGLPSAKLFTDLDRMKEGDQFFVHVLDETLAYEVDQILVVDPDQTESLATKKGEDYMSLVTCTPYGINTQRMIVRGHRVPFVEEKYEEVQKETALPGAPSVLMRLGCVVIGALIALAIVRMINLRKEHMEAKALEREISEKRNLDLAACNEKERYRKRLRREIICSKRHHGKCNKSQRGKKVTGRGRICRDIQNGRSTITNRNRENDR